MTAKALGIHMDEASERRAKYFGDISTAVDRHRSRGFEYEKEAIAYSTSALKILSYLNGGGLLAMPAAVALFHASMDKAKFLLIGGAGCFVVGLLFIALAQGCAFFTMAKRSESQNHFADEQTLLLNMVHYPEVGDQPSIRIEATESRKAANHKVIISDRWRFAGLLLFWLSLLVFIAGCRLAARSPSSARSGRDEGVDNACLRSVAVSCGCANRQRSFQTVLLRQCSRNNRLRSLHFRLFAWHPSFA